MNISNINKIVVLAVAGMLMVGVAGCRQRAKKQDDSCEQKTQFVDIHNARNSLDVEGTYEGAVDVVVTLLPGQKYERSCGEAPLVEGEYRWNEAGNTVTLVGLPDRAPNRYFVAEGRLVPVDDEGNRLTGDDAAKYSLFKK